MHLREVLEIFEKGDVLSLAQIAQQWGIEQSALEGMILFWVRKGKLREITTSGCSGCSAHKGCPVVVTLPRRFELVTETSGEPTVPACTCSR
ncbi:MAG: hypothetical protein IT322_02130 [Anaerolineae bacterium]|nr:hypothetical protein [Anaerolineae bacterium]